MTAKYSVSFEFNTKNPVTIKGVATAGSPHTLAARALREAKKKAQDKDHIKKYGTIINWTSIVVLIDRYEFMKQNETEQNETEEETFSV